MKKSVVGHPALSSDSKSFAYVLQIASRIFLSADDEDRSGLATTSTAQAFVTYSSSITLLKNYLSTQNILTPVIYTSKLTSLSEAYGTYLLSLKRWSGMFFSIL
jgi:hypothetical protein